MVRTFSTNLIWLTDNRDLTFQSSINVARHIHRNDVRGVFILATGLELLISSVDEIFKIFVLYNVVNQTLLVLI